MSDDWNSDGLNDNWDEAHEFGIDLDGSPSGAAADAVDGVDGLDADVLQLFDAADLLGADLLRSFDLHADGHDAQGLGALVDDVVAQPLPYGAQFTSLLARLGADALAREDLLAFIAGVSVANPFRAPTSPAG